METEMAQPGFWDRPEAAQALLKTLRRVRVPMDRYVPLARRVEDFEELLDLASQEEDGETLSGLEAEGTSLLEELQELELALILTGPYDAESAILTLHAGAGGTEAQDWTEMLLRMYLRWAERHGYDATVLDSLPGEEAGLKSSTVAIRGDNAYGFLRAERGVHRLVRLSPFDASGRRHTSFASVDVVPDLKDDGEVEIRPEDLKVDTFRASGAGGQHVNKTESAIRITHLPTGIVVTCQNERSQHANRDTAMRVLRGKLAELQELERQREMDKIRGVQQEIGFGSQIRSYVFQPYTVVRDHRTRTEVGNVQAVMDGEIDPFIRAFLQAEARGALVLESPGE
jgi:peptide chain release factor 2